MSDRIAELAAQRIADAAERTLRTSQLLVAGKILVAGKELLNLAANDYLGLAATLAHSETDGWGSGAARLVSGNDPAFDKLESTLTDLHDAESALIFGSGYLANTGLIPALVGKGDVVISDRLVHASILDGIALSRARHLRYRHCDAAHLEKRLQASRGQRCLVITESVFSMDGDRAPLAEIATLCQSYGTMLHVDEAHSVGCFGPGGAGLCRALGVVPDTMLGTFGKAYGTYGAFVISNRAMRSQLVNCARSFIYNTGLPPALVRATQAAVEAVSGADAARVRLHENARLLRGALGLPLDSERSSQIVPYVVGDNARCLALAAALHDRGIAAIAIRPPTVPASSARIRFTVQSGHAPADLQEAAAQLREVCSELM